MQDWPECRFIPDLRLGSRLGNAQCPLPAQPRRSDPARRTTASHPEATSAQGTKRQILSISRICELPVSWIIASFLAKETKAVSKSRPVCEGKRPKFWPSRAVREFPRTGPETGVPETPGFRTVGRGTGTRGDLPRLLGVWAYGRGGAIRSVPVLGTSIPPQANKPGAGQLRVTYGRLAVAKVALDHAGVVPIVRKLMRIYLIA